MKIIEETDLNLKALNLVIIILEKGRIN